MSLRRGFSALIIGALIAVLVPAPSEAVSAGTRIPWQGGSYYLHGANVPWFNWGCDFGCGTGSGASNAGVNAALDAQFALAKNAGMRVLRWWVFYHEAIAGPHAG